MRLQTKFALLLFMLGLALAAGLGFAAWSLRTLDTEITRSYAEITRVFDDVDSVKQALERQLQRMAAVLSRHESTADAVDRTRWRQLIDQRLEELELEPSFPVRVGTLTAQDILRRSEVTADLMHDAWALIDDDRPDDAKLLFEERVVPAFEAVHNLIETVENQLLDDAAVALQYGRDLRQQLGRILLASVVVAGLVALLALMLFRRWVIEPVLEIRRAAEAIAAGDFSYRIRVAGRDELSGLADQVNRMAGTIVGMQQEAVERERLAAVGEMLRRLVHNLRNPLAGIRCLAELTRASLPDGDLRDAQGRILATVDRFEQWLKELLHSTTPAAIHSESDSPQRLLEGVREVQSVAAGGRGVRIEVDCAEAPERVAFDRMHLEQAVMALASNAIEATPDGGTVRLIGRAEDPGRWEIRIEDSGPGVPLDLAERIFSPYFTTKRHGTGIGLALVQNVVQAHGGSVRVERSELGGAAFIVTLPRDARPME